MGEADDIVSDVSIISLMDAESINATSICSTGVEVSIETFLEEKRTASEQMRLKRSSRDKESPCHDRGRARLEIKNPASWRPVS